MTGRARPGEGPGGPGGRPTVVLVPPAVASWATAVVLLGCPAEAAAAVAAASALAAVIGWAAVRGRAVAAGRLRRGRGDPGGAGPGRTGPARRARPWAGGHVPVRGAGPAGPATGVTARVVAGVLVCVAATAAVVAATMSALRGGPVPDLAARGAAVVAEVVLTGDPRVRPHRGGVTRLDRVVVEGRLVAVAASQARYRMDVPVVVLGSGEGWRGLLPSQRIRARGRLRSPEPGEPIAAVLLVRGSPEPIGGPSAVQRAAGALRAGLREASDVLPPDQRGLLPGLVVGDVSRMDRQVELDFKAAGLSHLTAVSGANLAVIAGAALLIARWAGLPLPARAAVAIVAMIGFTVVARPSPSVLRALVMGAVAAIALGTGRSRDGVAALSAAVLGLILFDPALARQYGFALSVSATAGILVLAPRWRERLARRMPMLLAEAVSVPAAAQAAVTPVLVLMSGGLDLVAIPANLLAEPAVPFATMLGFAAAALAPISMPVAQLVVRPAGLAVGWIIMVAEHAARLPFATVPWPEGMLGLGLLAVAVLAGWVLLRTRALRRVVAALVIGAAVAVLVGRPVTAPWPPPGWLLVACAVGQGDALAVSAGSGAAVVVDTGPEPGDADRCLRDLGVRRVPLLVLTHPHLDHVGGLPGVLRGRAVEQVVVSPGRVPEREAHRVSVELRARRVAERAASPGVRWRFGPITAGLTVELTVLAPAGGAPFAGQGEGAIANNASVVLLVRWLDAAGALAGSALLAGDLETEGQAALLRLGVPHVDLLKVPHHGSLRQDPDFLAATGARAALISVGEVNDYGHPAPLTLRRLAWLGMRTYRTDRSGDLAVVEAGGRLAVVARGADARR